MAAVGALTGLISSLPSPLPDLRLEDPEILINAEGIPLHAGVAFGAALAIMLWRWARRDVGKCLLAAALTKLPFAAKPSTPWRPDGGVHDFMHAKVTVADDTVFLGSFNLSRSGEKNAENMLEVRDAELADRMAAFIDEVRGLYPEAEAPGAA